VCCLGMIAMTCWRDWDDIPGEEQLIKTVITPLLLFVWQST
jgi:hypothetical protein